MPLAPVVAAQPVTPESTPVPLPGKSDIILVVLGAAVILITIFIGISVFQKSVLAHEKNRKAFIDTITNIFTK